MVLVSWLTGSPEVHPEACEHMLPCLPLSLQLLVAAHSCLSDSNVRAESSHLSVCHSCRELSPVLPLPREKVRALRVNVLSGIMKLLVVFPSLVLPFFQLYLRCLL